MKGLGATPNKPSEASCLDTDIACEFVRNLVEVRFFGQVMWIMEGGRKAKGKKYNTQSTIKNPKGRPISDILYHVILYVFLFTQGEKMGVSYKKLFKLMIDKGLKKKDVKRMASIGNSTMTKLANDENVTMEVMAKICRALDCTLDDIVEISEED